MPRQPGTPATRTATSRAGQRTRISALSSGVALVVLLGGAPATPADPAPTGPPPPPTAPMVVDHTPPVVTLAILPRARKRTRREGVPVTVTLNEPGSVNVAVNDLDGKQLSRAAPGLLSFYEPGSRTVVLPLGRAARARLARRGSVRWRVAALGTDGVGNARLVQHSLRFR